MESSLVWWSKSSGRITPLEAVLLAAADAYNGEECFGSCRRVLSCRLSFSGVNSPLSIHSVAVRKNVSLKPQRLFPPRILDCLIPETCRSGEPTKFCEKTLHPLANGVGRGRIRFGNFVTSVSVQLDLNQKIELRVAEESFLDASMQEVPQHRVTFHEFVIHQWQGSSLLLSPARSINRTLSTSPFEELPLHGARNRKGKVRLTFFDLLGAQHLQKNAQGLLGNICTHKARLLLRDTANRAVQHGNKGHNHQRLDKLRFDGPSRKQFAKQVIGRRTGLGPLKVG